MFELIAVKKNARRRDTEDIMKLKNWRVFCCCDCYLQEMKTNSVSVFELTKITYIITIG